MSMLKAFCDRSVPKFKNLNQDKMNLQDKIKIYIYLSEPFCVFVSNIFLGTVWEGFPVHMSNGAACGYFQNSTTHPNLQVIV